MNAEAREGGDIVINAAFVYRELMQHQKECARRWWAVMVVAISNLLLVASWMAIYIVTHR